MRYIFIILIILSQILLSDCKSKTSKPLPKALDGKLNLEEIDWNFKTDGIVFLDGQWDFYWMRLLYPEDFQSEAKPVKSATVTVPGSWNGTIINQETLSGEGFATYKLTIPIDQSQVGQTLALKISYAATA